MAAVTSLRETSWSSDSTVSTLNIEDLLRMMVTVDASDLHIKAGSPPGLRVHGELKPIEGFAPLEAKDCKALTDQLLDGPERREEYERNRELDFSSGITGLARFRINLFHQRDSRAAVLRKIPMEVPKIEDMGFPPVLKDLSEKPRGLVLVTGPTGSGKSTTLASMIDYINRTQAGHILTIEDPIEFSHNDKQCFVNQREIGGDSLSFSNALRAALREDPDVILVGEMRDLETTALAITAAETGHLVFGTLHTTSAIQTVDRVIDVFPHEAQQQVRMQLSVSLQGVISQTLLPKIGGGRACAQEIMVATAGVRACIREGKTPQLVNALQTGASTGMITLEKALVQLVKDGLVTPDEAVSKANHPASVADELSRCGMAPKNFQPEPEAREQAGSDSRCAQRAVSRRDAPKSAEATVGGGGGMADDFEKFRARRSKA